MVLPPKGTRPFGSTFEAWLLGAAREARSISDIRERLTKYEDHLHAVTLARELRRIENALADFPSPPTALPDIKGILEAFPFPPLRYSEVLTQTDPAGRLKTKREDCIASEMVRMLYELRESTMAGHMAWHPPNTTPSAQRTCFARAFGDPAVGDVRSFLFVPDSLEIDDRDERWQLPSTAAHINFCRIGGAVS